MAHLAFGDQLRHRAGHVFDGNLGVDAVLLGPRCADPLYRRSIRVSMGTVFQVPWTRIDPWPGGVEQLRELGFSLVVCPLAGLFAAARAVQDVLTELREQGTTAAVVDRLLAFEQFNELVGLAERYEDEARFT